VADLKVLSRHSPALLLRLFNDDAVVECRMIRVDNRGLLLNTFRDFARKH
jgi:hypothetical protein